VIGGGIGGMALAAALGRVGIACEVHEQAKELREVGAGLTLWSNALITLKRLGAAERVLATGSRVARLEIRTPAGLEMPARQLMMRVARLEIRTPAGHVLSVTPLARAEKRFGVPGSVSTHRADLLRELVRASEPSRVHLRSRCVGIEESTSQVIAQFADGGEARGDFVVGADGLNSVVRSQLFGDASPRYAGYTCWRGVATLERVTLAPDTAFETWGRGRRFSVHHCGQGRLNGFFTRSSPSFQCVETIAARHFVSTPRL
jgi:2-polyprenyl-6-methoxyphenol hydroxylase-like FAD-dependent oxidoreductase